MTSKVADAIKARESAKKTAAKPKTSKASTTSTSKAEGG